MTTSPKSPKLDEAQKILDLARKSRPPGAPGGSSTPLNSPGKPSPSR